MMPRKVSLEKKSWSNLTLSLSPSEKESLMQLAYSRGLSSISQLIRQIAAGQIVLVDREAHELSQLDYIERRISFIEDCLVEIRDEIKK